MLWDKWVILGYPKKLKISCDRTDDYKGYCLTRLKLVTWGKHRLKSSNDKKEGINNKQSKAVEGINIKTGEKVKFYSMREAERILGIPVSNISKACLGKPVKSGFGGDGNRRYTTIKSAGGFFWNYR